MVSKYDYRFIFDQGGKPLELLGSSVADNWNDIFDLMDAYREMFVERRDGKIFAISEIEKIAHDLIEDMEEDSAEICLEIEDYGKRLHFLEFDGKCGFDLDEMQELVVKYFLGTDLPLIILDSGETRILHFVEESRLVFLVSFEECKFCEIGLETINVFISESQNHNAEELFIISFQKMTKSATVIVNDLKISFQNPLEVLMEINERNLEITITDYNCVLSMSPFSATFEKEKFCALLNLVKNASSNVAKKNTLENLAYYLFNTLDGFSVLDHNYRGPSEEIDLLVANESTDGFLMKLGNPLAIECRHRKTPTGSKAIRDFKGKLDAIGIKSGVLISLKGITGDKHDAVSVIRDCRKEGLSLLVVSLGDLEKISEGKDVISVLKKCYYNSYR